LTDVLAIRKNGGVALYPVAGTSIQVRWELGKAFSPV
jgi:hypothetical protein